MASRFRIPFRVQVPSPRTCTLTTSSSRNLTLSARLQAPKPARKAWPPPKPAKPQPQRAPLPPPSSPPKAESLDTLLRQRKWPLLGAGFVALGIGLYISLVVTSTLNSPTNPPTPSHPCCTTTTITPTTTSANPHDQPPPSGLPATLNTTTPTTAATTALAFDKSLDFPEWLSGIASLRKTLAARARGHVLEVAVGTGRNLRYYDWGEVVSATQDAPEARAQRERERVLRVLDAHRAGGKTVRELRATGDLALAVGGVEGEVVSFTGVDVSGDVVGVARDRVREAVPGLKAVMGKRRVEGMPRFAGGGLEGAGEEGVVVVDALGGRVRLVLGDAVSGLPSPPALGVGGPGSSSSPDVKAAAPTKYDTIIQTFGLCSVADPERLLVNMAAKLQPDTGRIILLEHGRGDREWMNKRLDKSAPEHFAKYGCWWNRDIEQLVREAAQKVPGLEVVKLERPLWFQWGTTLLIELRVNGQRGQGVHQEA